MDRLPIIAVKLLLGLFVIAFLASLYFETIVPLVRRGDYLRLTATSLGLVIIVAGLTLLVRSLLTLIFPRPQASRERAEADRRIGKRLEEIKSSRSYLHKLRLYLSNIRDATGFLASPLMWFLLGWILVLLGSYLINL